MIKVIIGQMYYQRDEDKRFKGYIGTLDFLSDYSNKLIDAMNKILQETKIDVDLDKVDNFLVNETTMDIELFNLSMEDNKYYSIEEFLSEVKSIDEIKSMELTLITEVNNDNIPTEVKKLLQILNTSINNDLMNLLKEAA